MSVRLASPTCWFWDHPGRLTPTAGGRPAKIPSSFPCYTKELTMFHGKAAWCLAALIASAAPAFAQEGIAGAAQDLWDSYSAPRNFVASVLDPGGTKAGVIWQDGQMDTGAIVMSDDSHVKIGGLTLAEANAGLIVNNLDVQTGRITASNGSRVSIGDVSIGQSTVGAVFVNSNITTGAITATRNSTVSLGQVSIR